MNPRKVELMSGRLLVLCLGLVLAAGYSCRARHAPPKAAPDRSAVKSTAVEKTPAPTAAAPVGTKAVKPASV
ncbi:MAG: hypothetical protein GXP54_02070, partial [Deltaproteobacteria bacterium]|nr:hypothetical protein [Deltaproteobacteria bacterium]